MTNDPNQVRRDASQDYFEKQVLARLDTIIELLQRPPVESTTTINVSGVGDLDVLAEQIRQRLIKVRQQTSGTL